MLKSAMNKVKKRKATAFLSLKLKYIYSQMYFYVKYHIYELNVRIYQLSKYLVCLAELIISVLF